MTRIARMKAGRTSLFSASHLQNPRSTVGRTPRTGLCVAPASTTSKPAVITSAFVLGAGLGTRLRSLTDQRPKPLIPVANKPLITYAFDHLLGAGIRRFVVNTHWREKAYATAFPDGHYRQVPIEFRHEAPEILETAGGIKNVEDLLGNETFVVYNGDILSDLPLEPAIRTHLERGNEVTMVLRSKDGPLQVAFDAASGNVVDIGKRLDPTSAADFLFTGIYLVSPAFFRRIPAAQKIGVVPIFLEMLKTRARLGGVVIDAGEWWDLGTREQYLFVHAHLAALRPGPPGWIAATAQIAATARITGATAIGARARVGEHATLHDCIVWDGAHIAPGSLLNKCIVKDDAVVEGIHSHVDL
jgi:NDP-sugar pyrophosphorylase family protein